MKVTHNAPRFPGPLRRNSTQLQSSPKIALRIMEPSSQGMNQYFFLPVPVPTCPLARSLFRSFGVASLSARFAAPTPHCTQLPFEGA